MFEMLFVR